MMYVHGIDKLATLIQERDALEFELIKHFDLSKARARCQIARQIDDIINAASEDTLEDEDWIF